MWHSINTFNGRLLVAITLASILVSNCTVGPDYKRPKMDLPTHWTKYDAVQAPPSTFDLATWWNIFEDEELDSLIQRAIVSNLDLAVATAKIREARAQRRVIVADAYPDLSTSALYSRSARSGNAASSSSSTNLGPNNLFQVGFDAGWELDIFGGVRRAAEAADATIAASEDNRRDVMVSLVAEVARNYLELRGDQRRIAIAQDNISIQRKTLDLIGGRFQVGLSNQLEVAQAQAQLANTESQVPTLEASAQASIHRLGILLGTAPTTLTNELSSPRPIPEAPPAIPEVLPSDLLRQRPDVRRAEQQLAAATAQIGSVMADLFPKFSLTGVFAWQSTDTSNLLSSTSQAWSFGPAVRWPIFDAGRIRAEVDVQNAIQEQALGVYEKTVLEALGEVEDALLNFAKERKRRTTLSDSVDASQRAVDISTELYAKGLVDFLNVLVNQRSLYQSQDQLVQSDQQISTDLVALYKALGGGWSSTAVSTP